MSLADSRLGRNPIRLIGINAPFEPALQFGREFSSDNNRRADAVAAWGFNHNGRAPEENSIKHPLPVREQSTLAHQLSPQLQSQLRGGMKPLQNLGRNGYSQRSVGFESIHVGGAIGHRNHHSTVSAIAQTRGGMGLRTVRGDYNFQV